jgi:hypothetical protein
MIDELLWWGHRPPLIMADCGDGDAAEFRHGLTEGRLALRGPCQRQAHRLPGLDNPHDRRIRRRRLLPDAALPAASSQQSSSPN